MNTSGVRVLAAGLLGIALNLVPLSGATPETGPAMDEDRMNQMMKMMTEMESQMRDMQGRMQGMGAMHGQMGRMMGQMGQMHGMMEQHHRRMMEHCPAAPGSPSAPTK